MNEKPVLGAALPIELLNRHRDWLTEHGGRDLEIQDPFMPGVLGGDWKPLVAQAKDALQGYTGRIGIHGPFDGLHIGSFDPAVRQFVAERYLRALEFCEALGATHMVIHSPFLFFGHPQVAHTPATGLEAQIGFVHETLREVVKQAEGIGCTLAVENIRDTNPQPLLTLVRSFASEHVRLSLDVGHAHLMHQIGGPTPDQWVREAGNLLGHLHLQDNDGQLDWHWSPGQGGVNWWALFQALKGVESQPRMILEVREKEEIRKASRGLVEQGLAL